MQNPLDSFPSEKLTTEVEIKLAARIKKGDESAITELAVAAMREAVIYTRFCCGAQVHDDELISICYDVLYRGAKRFDPKWKTRFVAFCKPGLRGYVRRSWRSKDVVKGVDNDKMVRPGDCAVDTNNIDNKSAKSKGYGELWDDSEQVTPEHEIVEADFRPLFLKEKWEIIEKSINRWCKPREKVVLELVYKNGLNFAEVANLLGVTRSAIQATHTGAVKKLKTDLLPKKQLFKD